MEVAFRRGLFVSVCWFKVGLCMDDRGREMWYRFLSHDVVGEVRTSQKKKKRPALE